MRTPPAASRARPRAQARRNDCVDVAASTLRVAVSNEEGAAGTVAAVRYYGASSGPLVWQCAQAELEGARLRNEQNSPGREIVSHTGAACGAAAAAARFCWDYAPRAGAPEDGRLENLATRRRRRRSPHWPIVRRYLVLLSSAGVPNRRGAGVRCCSGACCIRKKVCEILLRVCCVAFLSECVGVCLCACARLLVRVRICVSVCDEH
jgi:hypothetical protein